LTLVGCSVKQPAEQRQCDRISLWCQKRCSVICSWLCSK